MHDAYVEISLRDGYVLVVLRGELDVCTAPRAVAAFMAPAAAGATIIADLADLAFMDCGSLRELASMRAQARRAGGDLLLASPQPIVRRLLFLTDVVNHWPEFASVDEAVLMVSTTAYASWSHEAPWNQIPASPVLRSP